MYPLRPYLLSQFRWKVGALGRSHTIDAMKLKFSVEIEEEKEKMVYILLRFWWYWCYLQEQRVVHKTENIALVRQTCGRTNEVMKDLKSWYRWITKSSLTLWSLKTLMVCYVVKNMTQSLYKTGNYTLTKNTLKKKNNDIKWFWEVMFLE